MTAFKIFGFVLMVIGAIIAFKFKLILLGIGLAISALFIHNVFNRLDAYIKNPQTKVGLEKIKKWFSDKFKREQKK